MRYIKIFLLIAGVAALCAWRALHYFSTGVDSNGPTPSAGSHGLTASVRRVASSTVVPPAEKLIALTFDDGPRPYVLFGTKGDHPAPGLADILDQNGVKATFFVVGWRLTPKTWGEPRHEENIGVTCIDAA